MLSAALVLAALLAGAAGTWSPCALSAVDTLGAARHRGGSVARACAAFAAGAVAGGIATFVALGGVGSVIDASPAFTAAAIALVAAAAAIAEARGVRVVPQVRRQVPEPWRRALPPSVTAAAYGALLGLGFTTFVLTFTFWAVAAATFLHGSVLVAAAVGAAFGVGRAAPVVVRTAGARTRLGRNALTAITERPRLLRGWRTACAVALAAVALVAWP